MKKWLKKVVYKVFFKIGFYPTRIYSPSYFVENLQKYTQDVKAHRISRLSRFLKIIGNHKYYNELLKNLVPDYNLNIKYSEFIENGEGNSSLDTVRKITTIKNQVLFEKTYYNSTQDLSRVLWFYKNIFPLFHNAEIAVPKLVYKYEGEIISILEFDFIFLQKPSQNDEENYLVHLCKELYRISCRLYDHLATMQLPPYVITFKNHFEFVKGYEDASNKLVLNGKDVRNILSRVYNSKKCITHGDIQKTNGYPNAVLIDWDSFGIYPIGFDAAFLYFRLIWDEKELDTPRSWVVNNFKKDICESDWKDFIYNFSFFLFVMSSRLESKEARNKIEDSLIMEL